MEGVVHYFLEDCRYTIKNKRAISAWIINAIHQEKFLCSELNIILCSDTYLHQLNVAHLNHDTLTDIITFDYTEQNSISGDLFISIDRVKENSSEHGTSLVDELHRVIIHGILHLCGYKDKSLKDKQLMTEREDFYLSLRSF